MGQVDDRFAFRLKNVGRRFSTGGGIEITDLTIPAGSVTAVMGLSGSGKSTLLGVIGALVPSHPIAGTDGSALKVQFFGRDGLAEHDLLAERRSVPFSEYGFVFQEPHLLRNATGVSNILVPVRAAGRTVDVSTLERLLSNVNLSLDKVSNRVRQLSGGEKQRTAVVRSMIRDPQIILADEPTASLDPENGLRIMAALVRWQREQPERRTLVWVTHNIVEASLFADHIVILGAKTVTNEAGEELRVGTLKPGHSWPMANPRSPETIWQLLFDSPSPLHSGAMSAEDQARAIASVEPAGAATGRTDAATRLGKGATYSIAFAELTSAGRADLMLPPETTGALLGRVSSQPPALPSRLALAASGLALTLAAVLFAFALSSLELPSGVVPTGVTQATLKSWAFQAGALAGIVGLIRPLLRATMGVAWSFYAFGKWYQVVVFFFIATFLFVLVLARGVIDDRFSAALKGVELGHIILTERLGGRPLNDNLIAEWEDRLNEHLEVPRRDIRGDAVTRWVTDTAQTTAAAVAGAIAPLLGQPPPAVGHRSEKLPRAVYGRWSHAKLLVSRRSAPTVDPETACGPSAAAVPHGQADVLALNVEFEPEPVLKVMSYFDLGGVLAREPLRRVPPPRLAWQDRDGTFGAVVTQELLRTGLRYGGSPEPIDPYFCLELYGATYLLKIIAVVEKTPKEELVERYDVLVPSEFNRHANANRPGHAGHQLTYYNTAALYIDEPKLIDAYGTFFVEKLAKTTILPDAFQQIRKGLETSHQLSRFATAIIYFVMMFAAFMVAMLSFSFIRENEKSLCVMRAFGIGRTEILRLVAIQVLTVWAIAVTASAFAIGAVNRGLLGDLPKLLEIRAGTLSGAADVWLVDLILFSLAILVTTAGTVGYWWVATGAIGERLKQLE